MYREFKIDFTHAQVVKVLHGKPVRLTHSQLNKGHAHYFHVENYKKLVKAYESGKGTTLHMSHGEVLRTHQSGLMDLSVVRNQICGERSWKLLERQLAPDHIWCSRWRYRCGRAGSGTNPRIVKSVTGVGMAQPRRRKGIASSGSFRLG
ncbi:hypothetical protein GQ600_27238 [Phytophthora cactorum]|nr:hypothetical protein GQ600_27238 [Phytophthora cactorum]